MAAETLQQALQHGFLLIPDTYDGISTKAAERMGCKAVLLSASALTHSVHGTPDEGTLGVTDMVWSLTRMVEDNCAMPVIAEVRSGFSDNLRIMPYDLERVVKAGASALLLDDRAFGCGNDSEQLTLITEDVFVKKIEIAAHAAENTDCMVLARSFAADNAEAIRRCASAQKAGADMVGAVCMRTEKEAEQFSKEVSGEKFWSDLTVKEKQPEVSCEKLEELGYRFSMITFMEKGAWFGNLDYGTKNFKNGNTVYADMHDFDGVLRDESGNLQDYHTIFSYWKKWMPMEKEFQDLSKLGDRAYQGGKAK